MTEMMTWTLKTATALAELSVPTTLVEPKDGPIPTRTGSVQ